MNIEVESDSIPININLINNIKKTKIKLPSTMSSYNKNNNPSLILTKNNIKYNYYTIIINNCKKYNFNKENYNINIINNIIFHKHSHYISILKENILYFYINEFLKRYYTQKEMNKRFAKLYQYYQNYFKFFLKPTLRNLYFCIIIRNNSNKQANYFFDKYNNKISNKENKDNNNIIDYKSIFTKKQKLEIQNINNKDSLKQNNNHMHKIEQENNNNLSTLIFSYESLNNSKNKNINIFEETSLSLLSIANLINQNKIDYIKNIKKCKQNNINLYLKLDDKNFTQKSSMALTSSRSKKYDTLKEKSNNPEKSNYFHNIINNNKIINDKKNKKLLKDKKKNLFLFKNQKNNKNDYKEFYKDKKQNEILIIPTKNNLIKSNCIPTNISIKSKNSFKINTFVKNNSNKNIKPYRNKNFSNPLKINYYQSTQIINNKSKRNLYNISNLKKPYNTNNIINTDFAIRKNYHNNDNNKKSNLKDYCIFTTQITKIQKKPPFSRNKSNDLFKNQKDDTNNKNIYFSSSGINKINKKEKININNNICFAHKIFYRTFKDDSNKECNNIIIDNQKYLNNKNNANARNQKNKYNDSSIENKKIKLNKLIKDYEDLRILKNINRHNNNDEEKLKVYEYKNK